MEVRFFYFSLWFLRGKRTSQQQAAGTEAGRRATDVAELVEAFNYA